MEQITTIGLDIAKTVFQAHGASASGGVVIRKKLARSRLLAFFASLSPCTVAMEACGGAHYWARELGKLGHTIRLIPPAYVKPFVRRHKNDAADAEAICEAAQRPSMRFVPVKSEEQQASGTVFRARDLLVRQRTQCINALRGHLMEYGWIRRPAHAHRIAQAITPPRWSSRRPFCPEFAPARPRLNMLCPKGHRQASMPNRCSVFTGEDRSARELKAAIVEHFHRAAIRKDIPDDSLFGVFESSPPPE